MATMLGLGCQPWMAHKSELRNDHSLLEHGSCLESEFRIPLPLEKPPQEFLDRPDLGNMTRDMMIHGLSFFTVEGSERLSQRNDSAYFEVKCSNVYPTVRAAFSEMVQFERYLGVMTKLKELLASEEYDKARNFRYSERNGVSIPSTLSILEAMTNFKQWQGRVVEVSQVKGLTRALYCSPEDRSPRLAIAQTHSDGSGSSNTPVRETELIIERPGEEGVFDFFAYNASGLLTRTSDFHNSRNQSTTGPVPHSCMACHYDSGTRKFQNKPMTFGGIAYRDRLNLPGCFYPRD